MKVYYYRKRFIKIGDKELAMDNRRLSILYIKLKFTLLFEQNTILPEHKVSALRGGMGEMLLRQNCISDRECEECIFEEVCIVRKTMYTYMKRKPPFMHGKDSVGYLIECEDDRTAIREGDKVEFFLTLFGNNIVYFGQYLQAFYQLGVYGLGKHRSSYVIVDIKNMFGESLLEDGCIDMKYYHPEPLTEYVERRKCYLKRIGCTNKMIFHTPLSLKFQGKYLKKYSAEGVFRAVFRRIMMLDYFCEIYEDCPECENFPNIIKQSVERKTIRRYSTTQNEKINLTGIEGFMQLDEIPEMYMDYILAGEILHIGKNTSFGFGRYEII